MKKRNAETKEKKGNSRRNTLFFSPFSYRNREGYKFRKVMGDTC